MNSLRIAARKSPLARLQAYQVGAALQKARPGLSIQFSFKESLGDKNLTDALWKIPERGVFTEDFVGDLLEDRADIVVHSWKDLPTEARPGLELIGTLPRADVRDLLFFRPASLGKEHLTLLTSSPRRTFSAENHLGALLPFPVKTLETKVVRGNVSTRIRKLVEGEGDGLFMAKAALDRLLVAEEPEFAETRAELRSYLSQLDWMVLPLSLFPTAPAQGALAMEAKAGREDLRSLVSAVHCQATADSVRQERARFSAFGGGCHQKIGLIRQPHPRFGNLEFFYGHHDGKTDHYLRPDHAPAPLQPGITFWPSQPSEASLFDREETGSSNPGTDLFVARANGLPEDWKLGREQLIWTAGVESWKKLARRGLWVSGCADGLGETWPAIDAMAGRACQWTKLTHEASGNDELFALQATYRLVPRAHTEIPLVDAYFWMSASSCERALELRPEIRAKRHACGPGHTAQGLEKLLGKPVEVFLNYRHWKEGNACALES